VKNEKAFPESNHRRCTRKGGRSVQSRHWVQDTCDKSAHSIVEGGTDDRSIKKCYKPPNKNTLFFLLQPISLVALRSEVLFLVESTCNNCKRPRYNEKHTTKPTNTPKTQQKTIQKTTHAKRYPSRRRLENICTSAMLSGSTTQRT